MFSLYFILCLLITISVHGQTNDIKPLHLNNVETGYPFGKLRLSEDGKTEELIPSIDIEKSQLNQDPSSGVQPLPSPCLGAVSSTKLAYPRDKTKYIQCRDEFHYEIFTCPNNGEYNEQTNSCDLIIPMVDRCEQEKPCLNDGHCIVLSNGTFKCTCRPDWTGERCEVPLNSCIKKPCGSNAECRILKTIDYEQDYVCVCDGTRGYGLNCQEAVPNPCLTAGEQFFPYAFSQRAYIQCDGDLIYFQPCGPLLYWNQEGKICDRKRPAKMTFPSLLTRLVSNNNNQQGKGKEIINQEIFITTTVPTEQQNSFFQKGKEDNEGFFAFVPARVANRQQLQAAIMNEQQASSTPNLRENEQKTPELRNQSSQVVDSNQTRQDSMPKAKQWPGQQPWTPTSPGASSIDSNFGQSQFRPNNQQQQNFAQQNQGFGTQPWLNQVPNANTQSNQQFAGQTPSWQGFQNIQSQPQFSNQNQQSSFQTPTSGQSVTHLQGFQNPQDQFWPNTPNTQLPGAQSPGSQLPGAQLPGSQWSGAQSPGSQLPGAQLPGSQWPGAQSPQSVGFNPQGAQNFGAQLPSWQGSQTAQSQPWLQGQHQQSLFETGTSSQSSLFPQGAQNQNLPGQSWSNIPSSQLPGSQLPGAQSPQSVGFNPQGTQNFGAQQPSWQGSQTAQSQPWLQGQHQQSPFETGTSSQSSLFPQGVQNQNLPGQSWPNVPHTQLPGAQLPGSQLPGAQLPGSHLPGAQLPGTHLPGAQFPGAQLPQSVGSNPQGTQNFGTQPQPWQNTQTAQNQPWLQGAQSPSSTGFNTQQTPGFGSQQQPWKTAKPTQRDQQLTPIIPSGVSTDNKNRLNTGIQKNKQLGSEQLQTVKNQQARKNQENNQIQQNFNQPEASLIDVQPLSLNNEQSPAGQPKQNPPWLQTLNFEPSSTGVHSDQLQKGVQPQQQDQTFGTQQWLNQVSDVNTQNNQRFVTQPQSWQDKFITQPFQDQPIKSQSNQVIAFQPVNWPDTSQQNQAPLTADLSSDIQNTQFGFNQQQNLPSQNFFDQKQSWSTNQQFPTQGGQFSDLDDLKISTTQTFPSRSAVSNDQIKSPTEQRIPLGSISTLPSGTWKSRSS